MKKMILATVLITPLAFAQQPLEKNLANMQEAIHRSMECMAKIDQSQIQKIEEKTMLFHSRVSTLCSKGKREQAQKQAISFSKEMENNPMITAMNACNKMMAEMIPGMPALDEREDYSDIHVCDTLTEFQY